MGGLRATERFTRLRKLGEGAFGVVFEALDHDTGARIALKSLSRLEGGALYRFKQEFRALSDTAHENLVRLGELHSQDGEWFYTMELVDGVDWLTYVRGRYEGSTGASASSRSAATMAPATARASDPFAATVEASTTSSGEVSAELEGARAIVRSHEVASPEPSVEAAVDRERLRSTLRQIVAGLDALHAAGIVHRDMKPSNVMVTRGGRVVILDFGVAARLDKPGATGGMILGTPAYMAPEQAAGGDVGPEADFYAVGAMLFEAYAGRPPHEGTVYDVLQAKRQTPAPPLRSLKPTAPDDIAELCAGLLSIEPSARPKGREIEAIVGSSDPRELAEIAAVAVGRSLPFVGRKEALASLADALAYVKGGRHAVVLVHGSSGMGKSALVRAFIERVERESSQGTLVLSGRCTERETVPYKAFDGVIDELSAFLVKLPPEEAARLLPRHVDALTRLFPVLGRVPSVAAAPSRIAGGAIDDQTLRARAFSSLRECFQRLADRYTVILSLDDAQWGDADSASLLTELTAPPDPPALLLVLSCRTEERERSPLVRGISAIPIAGRSERRDVTIALDPLSAAEARELAETLCEGAVSDAASIAAESGGNPFFVGALARAANSSPTGAPERLEDVVQTIVARLASPARRLLEVLAVAGAPIDQRTAARAAGLSEDEAVAAVAALRSGRFARTATPRGGLSFSDDRAGAAPLWLETYHDKIREGVYAHMPAEALRSMHGALAAALEAAGESDPEPLFVHHRAAGSTAKAAEYARRAADLAARALAFDRAAKLYREALSLTPKGTPDALDLHVALADALANAGRGAESGEHYMAAVPLAPPERHLDLHRRAAEQILSAGHLEEARRAISAVLAHIGMRASRGPLDALIRLLFARVWLSLRGVKHTLRPEHEVPRALLEKVDVFWSLSSVMNKVDPVEGFRLSTHNLLAALRAGEPERLCRALASEACVAGTAGGKTLVKSRVIIAKARAIVDTINAPAANSTVYIGEGLLDYFDGAWRRSVASLDKGLAIHKERSLGSRVDIDYAEMISVYALVRLGDVNELSRRMPEYIQDAAEREDRFLATNLRLAEGNMWWLFQDDPAGGRAVAEDALAKWSQRGYQVQHWYGMQALAETDLYEGRAEAALARVQDAWPKMKGALLFQVEMIYALVVELRARCRLARGASADLPLVEKDARRLAKHRLGWARAEGNMLLAGVAARRKDAGRAALALRAAAEGFDACDMALYAATARARLAEWEGQGGDARAKALSAMEERGVKSAERLCELIAPGLSPR